jgi:hypothetical protein
MKSIDHVIFPAMVAIALTSSTPAAAEPAAHPAAPAVTAAAATASPKGPSFESGGIKATVVSAAAGESTVTLSLILENKTKDDLLVAVIGEPGGVSNGSTFQGSAPSGLTSCDPYGTIHDKIVACLTGEDPKLPVQEFTLISQGNAVPVSIPFHWVSGADKMDKTQPFSFSMTVASIKDDQKSAPDSSDPLQTHKSGTVTNQLPHGLRFISIGIPSISLSP